MNMHRSTLVYLPKQSYLRDDCFGMARNCLRSWVFPRVILLRSPTVSLRILPEAAWWVILGVILR